MHEDVYKVVTGSSMIVGFSDTGGMKKIAPAPTHIIIRGCARFCFRSLPLFALFTLLLLVLVLGCDTVTQRGHHHHHHRRRFRWASTSRGR